MDHARNSSGLQPEPAAGVRRSRHARRAGTLCASLRALRGLYGVLSQSGSEGSAMVMLPVELGAHEVYLQHTPALRVWPLRDARRVLVGAAAVTLALIAAAVVMGGHAVVRQGVGRDELLTWSNFADDGEGVLGGQQHGVAMTITSCDPDDPACTFQTSNNGYTKGQWVSNLNTNSDRKMEVNVRSDLRQGSSYEDDVGEGPLAGVHKTDEKGVFKEWTPRPRRFREREFSRVRVGVADADGMTSWKDWRKAHPDRTGHGNLALHPYKVPSTDPSMVFRGPLNQPREVSPIDQDYDMTDVNKPLPVPVPQPHAAHQEPDVAPQEFVHDGVVYVSVGKAPISAVKEGIQTMPLARAQGPPANPFGVNSKDQYLLKALHDVVEEMHSSEAEYSTLKNQLDVLQAQSDEVETKARASQARLKNFASEEARILEALEKGSDGEGAVEDSADQVEPEQQDSKDVEPAERVQEAHEGYTVEMKLGFDMSLSNFDNSKQQACERALAATVGTDVKMVRITGIDEASVKASEKAVGDGATEKLQGVPSADAEKLDSSIIVSVSIEESSEEAALSAAGLLLAVSINEQLAKEDLPDATIVEAARIMKTAEAGKAGGDSTAHADLTPAKEENEGGEEVIASVESGSTSESEGAPSGEEESGSGGVEAPNSEGAPAAEQAPDSEGEGDAENETEAGSVEDETESGSAEEGTESGSGDQEQEQASHGEETPEQEAETEINESIGDVEHFFEGEPQVPEDASGSQATVASEAPRAAATGETTDAAENPPATAQDLGLIPGFTGKYYRFGDDGPRFAPNLDVLAPEGEITSLVIDFNPEGFRGLSDAVLEDHFAFQWTGKIEIKKAGEYSFSTTSDDGSYLWIDGSLVVDNGGLHGPEEMVGSVSLTEGFHDFKVEFFENSGGADCVVKFSGPDTDGEMQPITGFHQESPVAASFAPVRTLEESTGLTAGFEGSYYFFGDEGIPIAPNLHVLTPSLEKVTEAINFESDAAFSDFDASIPHDRLAGKWTGLLKIEQGGSYTFSTTSDDGSFLWIDGNLVVNNGGLHGPESQSGTVELAEGFHSIRVEFFENSGGAVCMAKYSGPDTTDVEVLIPAWHD